MIIGVLATGPEEVPRYVDKLRRMIVEIHGLMSLLSTSIKPKLHHMHHILDGVVWLGKLVSCFVTERKHRTVKDCALHVLRHIEHTVLADLVNRQCRQLPEGVDLFKAQLLVHPRAVEGAPNVCRSRAAVLRCGEIRSKDIVWFKNAECGRIAGFYEVGESIIADVVLYQNVLDDPCLFHEDRQSKQFVDVGAIVDACTWYYDSPGVIKVVIPPIVIIHL